MDPEKSPEKGKIQKDTAAATGSSLSGEELERILKTGTGGLSQAEVQARLQEYGFNDIPEVKKHPLLRFLRYFWGPIPWMIEVAALLSAIIQHGEDFSIIFLMLVINAVVGGGFVVMINLNKNAVVTPVTTPVLMMYVPPGITSPGSSKE